MVTQLGLSILIPILICTLGGYYLDRRFGLRLTLPLMCVGFLAGGRNGYVLAKGLIVMEEREDEGYLEDEKMEKNEMDENRKDENVNEGGC